MPRDTCYTLSPNVARSRDSIPILYTPRNTTGEAPMIMLLLLLLLLPRLAYSPDSLSLLLSPPDLPLGYRWPIVLRYRSLPRFVLVKYSVLYKVLKRLLYWFIVS